MKFNLCLIVLLVTLLVGIPLLGTKNPYSQIDMEPITEIPAEYDTPAVSDEIEAEIVKNDAADTAKIGYNPPVWKVVRGNEYDLNFNIYNQSTGEVETVYYKDYVRGAICAEMSPNFHSEAMKAQGIAALTYALYNQNMNRGKDIPALSGADFAADPANWKVYVTEELARRRFGEKFDLYWNKICAAADEASQKVLIYDNQPILAAYHSTSSGMTEGAENVWNYALPYLVPVSSRGDLLAPQYETKLTFSLQEMSTQLTNALPEASLGDDPQDWLEVLERSDGGYVTSVRVGSQTIHGKELRAILGLRSSDFTVSCDGEIFRFKVYGYGHGVGLSQYGADFMALQGSTAEEILCYYFTGAQVVDLEEFIENF